MINNMNLEEALAVYRDMKEELGPAMKHLSELEAAIKDHVRDTGELATIKGAKVTISKPQQRARWDGKGLEGYGVANPEIMAFCQKYETKPTVSIKIDPNIAGPDIQPAADPSDDDIPF